VKVNDINMYYEIHGEGFPLLMIRGLSSDVYRWPLRLIKELSKNFKVVLFDNRGAGRTDKPDIEYSIKMMAEDTIGLMICLSIEKAHILGYSMGGSIAQEISLSYPEKVTKLILCSAGCGGPKSIPASKDVRKELASDREGLSAEDLLRNWLPIYFTENFIQNKPDEVEDYIRKSLLAPIPPYAFKHQLAAVFSFNSYERLKNIKSPTLMISGKEDILVPHENSILLAENIPGAKLSLLDNLGHGLFTPDPLLIAELITDFLI
jgi:pimeloyl-ACP methyl ester carboxylesterase